MWAGLTALLLFVWFLGEWTLWANSQESARDDSDLAAKIRMDIFKSGKNPWLNHDDDDGE